MDTQNAAMPIQLQLIDAIKKLEKPGEPKTVTAAAPGPETLSDSSFEMDVSRAVHSALIMRPIFELEARRILQGETDDTPAIWEGLDVMWIAFAILDAVSELSEYQAGATRSEVIEKILPLARKQTLACGMTATDSGLNEVLNKVFDYLVNRRNRYLPFRYSYFNGIADRFMIRKFWLIKTVYTGKGSEALFSLTDEGYAAYFGLHETNALDAAAIGNLRIKMLIERGNLDDAVLVADGNRKQCARKALEIRNIRRMIRRNIQAVDFEHVRTLAEEGVNQATDIQKESNRLHNMVIENILTSHDEKHGSKLHRLAELLERLNHQLMKLSAELQQLPDDYHNHSHKLFRKRSMGILPPMDQVVGRIFGLGEEYASEIGHEFIARFDPPARRPLFDPAAVIEACDRALERQYVLGDQSQKIIEIKNPPIDRFVPELDEVLMNEAFEIIHTAVSREGKILLSNLLINTGGKKYGDLLPVALAMAVFQCLVERRLGNKYRIQMEIPDSNTRIGVDLNEGYRYRGHELILKTKSSS